MYDAICVGGGVAGSATAAFLARRGRRVLVLERAGVPRRKACGEGILPHGVEVLGRLGVDLSGARRTRGIRFRVGETSAVLGFPQGHGLAVPRPDLDRALLGHAERLGAEVRRLPAREIEPGRVRTDEGVFEGRILVGADGVHSLFHDAFSIRTTPDPGRVGFSTHWAGVVAEPDLVEVVCFRWGEVYIAPVGDGLTLTALLVDQRLGVRKSQVPEFLRRQLPNRTREARRVGPVLGASRLAQKVDRIEGEGWLLVGDSAGSIDPITGEGMSLALMGAERGAEAVIQRLEGGDPGAYARWLIPVQQSLERLTRLVLFAARRPRLARLLLTRGEALSPLLNMATARERFTWPRVARILLAPSL